MHAFCCVYNVCIYVSFYILFNKLWDAGFRVFEVFFVPSHTYTYLEHFAHIHTVRQLPRPWKNLGKASSQLSWGENIRMGSRNTFTQIEPFSFIACNGWGSGCPTSPTKTTVGINLGAFRVVHPESRHNQPKPAIGRSMSVHESHLEIGHVNGLFMIDCHAWLVYHYVYTNSFRILHPCMSI